MDEITKCFPRNYSLDLPLFLKLIAHFKSPFYELFETMPLSNAYSGTVPLVYILLRYFQLDQQPRRGRVLK